jgi:hypothetical protein
MPPACGFITHHDLTMSFRPASREEVGSPAWCRAHRARLLECGIPDTLVDDPRMLTYVLLHGREHGATGWTPDWLSDDEARRLLAFLRAELPNPAGYDLVDSLLRRVGEARPPGPGG